MPAPDDAVHGSSRTRIEFTLNGSRRVLTRDQVDSRLAGVAPEPIRKHAVHINGTWYPVRQAFGRATGLPGEDFTSQTARRHLAALGYQVHGQIEHRTDPTAPHDEDEQFDQDGESLAPRRTLDEAWHTEANVQAAVVTWLAGAGWRIARVADTATKEHGIDVEAARGNERVGIEVKGYPSRTYADAARAGQVKRTQPSTQAGHWYAQAVLAAMRLRTKRPEVRSVIALPDFPRYRQLFAETADSLRVARIELWWVTADGQVADAVAGTFEVSAT